MTIARSHCTHGFPREKRVTSDGVTEEFHGKHCTACEPNVVQERYVAVTACASVERSDFPSVVKPIRCALCKQVIQQYEPFVRGEVPTIGGAYEKHTEEKHCAALRGTKNGAAP